LKFVEFLILCDQSYVRVSGVELDANHLMLSFKVASGGSPYLGNGPFDKLAFGSAAVGTGVYPEVCFVFTSTLLFVSSLLNTSNQVTSEFFSLLYCHGLSVVVIFLLLPLSCLFSRCVFLRSH
jgi:hypothetical protein